MRKRHGFEETAFHETDACTNGVSAVLTLLREAEDMSVDYKDHLTSSCIGHLGQYDGELIARSLMAYVHPVRIDICQGIAVQPEYCVRLCTRVPRE